ncbi:MAG: AAA family ATPase [Bacilli bacterium]
MYLKEIRAFGFKSFAEKTIIEFNNSVSGVVGPNGSGKSNIVDAVRWVLGEQSVKSLRGEGTMSEVIFSGSKSRKASLSASVTLVFDNTDHYLPVDYTEVSIKRSIYKTGENEYYLNNEKCRLKDITDLLIDTGVSKESFNIISQGDIGAILSKNSEDRRLIFEAASGVLKYKKRKDEALRKLDRTHDNLERINDIILELENNINPLKEQCKNAKIYLENKEKLEKIEVSLIVSEVESISLEYHHNKKIVSTLNQEVMDMESDSNVDSSKLEKLKLNQAKENDNLYKLQQELVKLTSELENLGGKKNLIIERKKYQSEDAKVHQNIINLKEGALIKENEIFALKNQIDILIRKKREAAENFKDVNSLFEQLKEKHKANITSLTEHNRLENETKYRIDMLKNSIDNNSNLPFAVKQIINNPKLSGIHNVIGKLIETDEEYGIAVSTALGASSSYVVIDDEFCAKEAISFLKNNKYGRVTFFPLSVIKEKYIDNETYRLLREEPDFISVASDLVRYESTYDKIIKNQLGTTIVVKDVDSASFIARKINYKYRVVTLDGELLHVGGSLTGGALKNQTSIILEKHDLETNIQRLNALETNRTKLEEIINLEDQKYKDLEFKRNTLLDQTLSLENDLKYELNKKNQLEESYKSIKEELSDMKGVINNTLSAEESKLVDEFYKKEKEKNTLNVNISSLLSDINQNKELISQMELESKYNNSSYYKKQQELKTLEIKVNRADVKLDNLLNTLTEEYSMTYEKAKANYFLDMDQTEARKIVDKCKVEMKRLGNVNIGAIEEYDRVSERYNFLNNQKEDLLKAENTILEIIKELDEIMKVRFNESFNVIKVKFKEVFKKLFGGGDAELKLTDPSNVLTTGIEIKALPPGKSLQHISLLSGGEKTLTAISLLFAILEARPVPFCILDEVEAALDEVNVDNFGKFLGEFKNKTQFIIITHKKKTMEYADVLYGITMQESGVSKLVSVKLEDI